MKSYYPGAPLDLGLLAGLIVTILALFLLQGCATTEQVKKTELQPTKPSVKLSSEARADFEAAMELVKAEEYEKSIELFNKVVKAAPNNAVASINLALVYKKLDKLKEAEESLKLAMIAEPENPIANNEFALLYRKTGRFTEARASYEKILEKYPNFIMVHKNLGILCDLYMKDYECAYKHYVIYSEVNQEDKAIKIWIADVKKRLGR